MHDTDQKPCAQTRNQPISEQALLKAERHVIAGVLARLLPRYRLKYGETEAATYGMAVINTIFSLPDIPERDREFMASHKDAIITALEELQQDNEIRAMVTEAVTMRIVANARIRCCNEEDQVLMETLQGLGLFLAGATPPTPRSYVQKAYTFFMSAPRG